jgi:hypothetical protein
MKSIIVVLFATACIIDAFSQDLSKKYVQRLDAPFMLDSASTMFFPVSFGQSILSNPKLAMDGYSANILVYDFTKDSYRSLFDKDTFVKRLLTYPVHGYRYPRNKTENKKWLFLLVKPADTNGNGRMDDNDASIAYVTDARGENLRALTTSDVNVVDITFYDKQGFALLNIQRDTDGDKSFKYEDKVYYYQKVDLNDLSVGKPIEVTRTP